MSKALDCEMLLMELFVSQIWNGQIFKDEVLRRFLLQYWFYSTSVWAQICEEIVPHLVLSNKKVQILLNSTRDLLTAHVIHDTNVHILTHIYFLDKLS